MWRSSSNSPTIRRRDTPLKNTVLVLVPALHRGVMPALEYARSLSPDCRAVHICTDPERMPQLRERWEQWGHDVPLVILNSPYRSLISPIMRYLDAVQHERRNHTVTVVVPEFVATRNGGMRCCTGSPGCGSNWPSSAAGM